MTKQRVENLIARINAAEPLVDFSGQGGNPPALWQCRAESGCCWEEGLLEEEFGIAVPAEYKEVWQQASSLYIWKDVVYGSFGLQLLPPTWASETTKEITGLFPEDFIFGDLIVGTYHGFFDRVVLRCDPSKPDFGTILAASDGDSHEHWATAAQSLCDFLEESLNKPGFTEWFYREKS